MPDGSAAVGPDDVEGRKLARPVHPAGRAMTGITVDEDHVQAAVDYLVASSDQVEKLFKRVEMAEAAAKLVEGTARSMGIEVK
jgi:hypothetical protein